MKYLDFDLVIEPSADGFVGRVSNAPGGAGSIEFTAPFSDLEVENFLLRIGRSRHTVRRIESPELTSAKVFGSKLFNTVFAGDVRACLRSSIDEANRQGLGLRVRLHLGRVPALADLPWEFLYNQPMNRFLGLSVETPLVRYLELPERIRPITVKPPLRVLMMISSPTDFPQLDVQRESAKMSEALADLEARGLVTVERQEVATLAELQRRLRQGQYHIFHFIGHGGFDEQAQDGVLILEDQEERGRRVSAQFLGTLLHDHRPLRLAVLNACEGARASRTDPFAGTAQSLMQQGIPAVIAMQFEITDEAAICFTREFYAAIAVGYPVDAALAEARKAIFSEVSEIEWGTPVLYMRSPDGLIFEVEQVSESERRQMQISSLIAAARTAVASNDEATAIARAQEVLALDAGNSDAAALLREIGRQQELAEAYTAARAQFDEGRFTEALESLRRVRSLERGYRDVDALIAAAEKSLAHAADLEARARHLDDLRRGAKEATHAENWDDAIQKWQALLVETPDDHDVRAHLSDARKQQELWRYYQRGRSHYKLRHLKEALVEFHQLLRIANPYRDVATLVAKIESEIQAEAQESRPVPPVTPPGPVTPPVSPSPLSGGEGRRPIPSPVPQPLITPGPAKPARAQWFVMGGLLGAVAVIGVLVMAVVVIAAIYQNVAEQSAPAPIPGPGPDPIAGGDRPQPPPAPRPSPQPPAPAPIPGPAPAPAPAYDPNEMIEASPAMRNELQQVLVNASNNEIQARQTANPLLLQRSYTGNLLTLGAAEIEVLRQRGVVMLSTLTDFRLGGVLVSRDGTRAQADITERWESNFVNALGVCVGHFHERESPQTAFLQRTPNGWMIYDSKHHAPDPELVACH